MKDFINLINTYNALLMVIFTFLSALATIIIAWLTYSNLKEFKETRIEENRAYIVFYIVPSSSKAFHNLVLKNFGKSAGKVLSLKIDPQLDYQKSCSLSGFDNPLFFESNKIYLAPNQFVTSVFDFRNYPDRIFNVIIEYESLGRTFKESYQIDYSFALNTFSASPTINDIPKGLQYINESIQELIDTLR
ncbi:hypothetical protein SAMN05443428_1548 [Caloramator quimbayensis]|uniref:Uncharacterized protein n=1 Tax=Caloramator quimbayensis TaxID=1147123 RepID=A0A1T4YHY0_9CLOT|nr:hypothetical protein [Caloramator quimbayensis]SKB01178.1 hypothetical protein SAMN05443428_1548 [Caloramator quimbayensis]